MVTVSISEAASVFIAALTWLAMSREVAERMRLTRFVTLLAATIDAVRVRRYATVLVTLLAVTTDAVSVRRYATVLVTVAVTDEDAERVLDTLRV